MIALATDYFPRHIGEIVQGCDLEKMSLSRILQENGIIRKRMVKQFTATKINARDGRLLYSKPDDIAMLVRSQTWDQKGALIEYSRTMYPVDRYEFKVWVETA